MRRREDRRLGEGSQERGGLPESQDRGRYAAPPGAGRPAKASKAREKLRRSVQRITTSPNRIVCGAERVEGSVRPVNGFKPGKGAKRSVSVFQKQEPASVQSLTKRQAPLDTLKETSEFAGGGRAKAGI